MKKVRLLLCMLSLAGLGLLTACDDDDGGGSGGDPDPTGTNAPAALNDGDSMTFTSGDTSYTVNITGPTSYNVPGTPETGTYTYSKTGDNEATLTLDPADVVEDDTWVLTFQAAGSGSYTVNDSDETGTFTFSDAPAPAP